MAEIKDRKESKKEKRDRKKEKKEKKERKETKDVVAEESAGEETPEKRTVDVSSDDDANVSSDDDKDGKSGELEIDLTAQVPLSKKQQRLLKKGKFDMEKYSKKHPAPRPANEEPEVKSARSEFGVWIGNLSYDTTKEDIVRFITAKTASFGEDSDEDLVAVEEKDISRVNLPKKENKIKGFAYVDLPSLKYVTSVVKISESILNGRKLLIKNSSSFEGRPESDANKPLLKNPPLRILFVGNLSFDTSEDNLEEHFRPFGDIVRVRMATFQDTGKCKGFAFIDFKDETGPTAALKSKLAKKLINRPLRLEFGEDRSKRNPKRLEAGDRDGDSGEASVEREERNTERETSYVRESAPYVRETPQRERPARPPKRLYNDYEQPGKRVKSSIALASAQRASAAIVPSQGKKTTFD